jgi:hypothetical protein
MASADVMAITKWSILTLLSRTKREAYARSAWCPEAEVIARSNAPMLNR